MPTGTTPARELIDAGADVDAPDSQGKAPLGVAVHSGAPELVALLLASDADPMRSSAGHHPMLLSGMASCPSSTPLLAAALDAAHTGSHAILDVFLEHLDSSSSRGHRSAPADAEALVVAAMVAAVADVSQELLALLHAGFDACGAFLRQYEEQRRGAVRKLLLAAAQRAGSAAAAGSALRQHLPLRRRACVLLASVCLDVWQQASVAAQGAAKLQTVPQMLVSIAAALGHEQAG